MQKILINFENRWLNAIKNPKRTFHRILLRFYRLRGTRRWLEKWFEYEVGYKPNFDNPQTFNEKLNWLKLNDHNPVYHILVDKYEVKEHVSKTIGKEYVVPCYGIWDSFDEIDFEILPNSFVLKPTNWGCPMVVKDKRDLNLAAAKKYFKSFKEFDIFKSTCEWGYKGLKPRILAEKYLTDDSRNDQLQDYKFWCFNGTPRIMYFTIKDSKTYENFYDMEFKPLFIDHGFPRRYPEFNKPEKFEEMKAIATKLSQDIPFVRIDFYYIKGQVYFGEYTLYDWGGGHPFKTYLQDLELGQMIDLSTVRKPF